MLWRVWNETLPTNSRLPFIVDKDCSFCANHEESYLHLFRDCAFVKAVWFAGVFPCLAEHILRNSVIHFVETFLDDSTPAKSEAIVGKILTSYSNFSSFGEDQNNCEGLSFVEEQGMYRDKVDFVFLTDVSWFDDTAGLAVVMINLANNSWAYSTQQVRAESTMEAETRAIQCALEWTIQNSWSKIYILSDCQEVLRALDQKKCPLDWGFLNLSLLVLDLVNKLSDCNFFFIKRCLNTFANGLAKKARVSSHVSGVF
uniref:RNase H type-1 domain-containing protein n=1 Tax=Cannabis sativa TaxID=3483 RepID=A0A803NU84_CANSA